MKKQSVIMLSFCAALSASALEVTKDWKIVYPDKAVGVETVVEGLLKYMAEFLVSNFVEATGMSLVGFLPWRHMATTITTNPDTKELCLYFRLHEGAIGRVEIEDVTVEELGPKAP